MSLTAKAKVVGETETKNCKNCKEPFDITPEDKIYYLTKGWNLPERCLECRKIRRETRVKDK